MNHANCCQNFLHQRADIVEVFDERVRVLIPFNKHHFRVIVVEEDIILKCSFVFGAGNFHALNGYPFVLFGLSCENFESTDTNKLS